ncbi:MAG TPA: hypothetical protein VFH63_11960 [candidate division Zixibacteria bacterium]|nr:hypothetical protein [candidate division Zixibacteria bacterium]
MRADDPRQVAAALRRRGLDLPARLLLDAHRPLRPLLSQLATFISPGLRPLAGTRLDAVEAALADDAGYDRLLEALDEAVPPQGRANGSARAG